MASYTFENHTFRMVDRTDGKDIKVPSNMYPLNREAQLFTTETTDTISDAHVREIVNCIDGRMNNTYQNAEQVVRTLNVYGIPAVQYVGWVFMSDSAPMYQSFALVKGDHGGPAIIDLSVDPIWPQWEQEMAQYTTPDEMRAAFIEKQSKRWDVPNTERCVFGQVPGLYGVCCQHVHHRPGLEALPESHARLPQASRQPGSRARTARHGGESDEGEDLRQYQPEKFSAPTGYYSASWNKGGKPKTLTLREWANLDTAKSRKKFQDFLTLKMQPYSDVLSVAKASRFTGYHHNTLTNWCHNGYIRYFEISGGYMIPKSCLLNFLLSPHILDSYRPSKKLVDLAKEFSRQGKSTKKPTTK